LAVAAGCFSVVFGLAAFGAPFLILGAAIQPRARTSGRWLMWVGALLLSLIVVTLSPEIVSEGATMLCAYHDSNLVLLYSLSAIATGLVCWCDVALVLEAFKSKGHQWTRGSLDWVVWTVAIVLSAWCVWTSMNAVHGYRLQGGLRLDLILTQVGMDAVMLLFDVALIILAVKTRRAASTL
jgi:hypothetical protein